MLQQGEGQRIKAQLGSRSLKQAATIDDGGEVAGEYAGMLRHGEGQRTEG